MKNAAAFKATYSDWKLIRTRNCVQVVFEIPLEDHDSAYQALGGMPDQSTARWFAIARLTDGATAEASREAERSNTARRPSASRSYNLAQQAAICCNDPLFHGFLEENISGLDVDSASAAELVRGYCGVSSRSNIRPGTEAANRWHDLHSQFLVWRDNPDLVEGASPRINDCQSERT